MHVPYNYDSIIKKISCENERTKPSRGNFMEARVFQLSHLMAKTCDVTIQTKPLQQFFHMVLHVCVFSLAT